MPRALDDLVQRLCARKLEDRPESAGSVRDELRALVRHTSTPLDALRHNASQGTVLLRARFVALPAATRALLVAGGIALLLALAALSAGKRPAPNAHARSTNAPEGEMPTREPVANPSAAAPSLAQRAIQFVVGGKAKPQESAGVPDALREDAKNLIEATRVQERRRAAANILQYKPASQVFPHLLAVARLEQARSCRERKDAISEIAELKDARALPALRRLAESPRTGCGFLGLRDCNSCFRPELRRTIDGLDADHD
jgi:serine/threonine-protein kinase